MITKHQRADATETRTRALVLILMIACALVTPFSMRADEGAATADVRTADPAVDIDAFFGTFRGQASRDSGSDAATRDLSVTVAPGADRGFVVSWTTIVRGPDGHDTRKSYSIAFQPTQRPGIYRSAMRANMFGDRVPLDPFTGEPLIWARLAGRTLSVFALIILSDGGYDMQVYDRTLSATGLDLVFTRWINREQVTKIMAELIRTD